MPALPLPGVPGYEILEVLGRGSMGVVYKARQAGLHRHVALKMILAGAHVGQEKLQRFITEARVVASLQHPNIVQIYEINLHHDSPYFSMELVEGGTLADRLGGRPQPFREAAQLVLTLARTIHVAHQNGIVHRDLKPANILIASPESRLSHVRRMAREMEIHPPDLCLGTPKITDFGLAKDLHAEAGQTESGVIMGTPSYMAPEQAEGKSREVGPTADIYALGAILYEMLTGRPPFTAESPMETILLLFQVEPVSPSRLQPKIPRDLETICLKCLHKDPQRRYASAEELANDLHRFLVGEPILARPASLTEQVWKWMRRRPALATLAACSVLAVVSLLGLALWHQVELQARLGQALRDEREARGAQEAATARERLAQLRDRLMDLVRAGETAMAAQDWQKAQVQLARARDQVADEPDLAELRTRIEQSLQQTNRQRQDHERLHKFLQRRNEALFHATQFAGGNLASAVRETRAAALEALALFGVTPGSAAGPAVDSPYYPERQKAEIVAACYELLVVLADAAAQPLPGQTAPDERRQSEEALRILDRTAGLGVTTQAYHRRRAHYLAQAGRGEAAAQERRRADALRPTTPLDHFLLGQEQYRLGDCRQAIPAFQNVLQVQPDHFWASYYLGLCWLKTRRPDQAATCLTSCLGQRQDFPWLYLLRASAWGELGQFARAEADFETALRAPLPDAARYGLLINRGVLRIRQGRLEKARDDLQQAIALRPRQYQGYLNLAQAYLKGEQLPEALAQLDQAIRLEPGLAPLYRTRARLHILRQDQTAALADLDRAIRLEAGTSPPALTEDHLERGRLLQQRKDFQGALAACDAALRLRPRDAQAHRLRAEALLELKRLPEALQSLDDCLKYGSPEAGVFRARAALRVRLGQCAGAQTDYTRALELEPDAPTYAARGWCYLVADVARLALPDFEEAIRLDPDLGDAYAGRGYARSLLGEDRLAVQDAEEALRHGPPSPRLYYNVARLYAHAVAGLERGLPRDRWGGRSLRDDWQQRALGALTLALDMQPQSEAARFWQDVISGDKVLNPIQPSPGFRQLAARYPPQKASTAPGRPVPTEH
jgi:tetratricopeptide (TPR) repeat protein/tRNA A-37 threonylcarbamoyl transferase component Bud32